MQFLLRISVLIFLFAPNLSFASDKPVLHLPWQRIYGSAPCSNGSEEPSGTHAKKKVDQHALDFDFVTGESIYASASGIAYTHTFTTGWGKHVKIDHGGGYYTLYAHLNDFAVSNSQPVDAGDRIGYAGKTGCENAPVPCGDHLHTALHKGDASIAEYTQSIPSDYWVSLQNGSDPQIKSNTDFECALPYGSEANNPQYYYYSANFEYAAGDEVAYCNSNPSCYLSTDGDPNGGASIPDFAWINVWVEDATTGIDIVNVIQPNQSLKARCKHINDGDDHNDDIEVKALLSNGENVDSNPTTVATDNIQSSNLGHGETHSETFLFNAPTTPGIYNITCDTDTDDDVTEEHESNNKLDDPYVFEVATPPNNNGLSPAIRNYILN